MVHELSTAQWILLTWFATAVVAEVVSTMVFAARLRRRGVELIYGLLGVPGYLEYRYFQWCRANDRNPTAVILLRLFLVLNVIGAFVASISIFVSR